VAPQGLLLLVNKQHPLQSDYVPAELKDIKYYASDRSASTRYMVPAAADAFHALCEAAKEEAGYTIVMTTAYRSYGFQQILWNNYVNKDGEAAASRYSARPGTSEHQTGLATDISAPSVNYRLTNEFGGTPEGQWVAENAHRFGFILRFTKDGEPITGYIYEPWHIRYVGPEAAAEIHALGITLEEYLILLGR
jgi:D-alanyl-D-alanine carboxypeptidase